MQHGRHRMNPHLMARLRITMLLMIAILVQTTGTTSESQGWRPT